MESVIELQQVYKQFYFYRYGRLSFKHLLLEWFGRRGIKPSGYRGFYSLRDITFSLHRGECLGVIGRNGSGKSTLMKVVIGVYPPTEGTVRANGRVSFLGEITAGFQLELTGLENIYLMGALYGYTKRDIRTMLPEILDYSEMEEFLNVPLKYYSSGMGARLGFALALSVNPEILIIDEVFAVGDESFRTKCIDRIQQLKAEGTAILFVSHSMATVQSICDRVIWLEGGAMRMQGPVNDVIPLYMEEQKAFRRRILRLGNNRTGTTVPPPCIPTPRVDA
jgi:ABC-type polysaccharide/polyol phosphate transport system ATPase subunit